MLRNQLKNYKTIISSRVNKDHPVITYQDNMQMARTSLRHLRLSKLQKEKTWDFTVRGWRAADITGLESYFQDEKASVKPQRLVKDVVYKDTKIGEFLKQ